MKRSILYFLLLLSALATGGCSYFAEEAPGGKVSNVPRDLPVWAEVEVFDLMGRRPEIVFEKSGVVSSSVVAQISSQVVGNITSLNAMVGALVREGDVLAQVGNSLATDMADLQSDAAGEVLDLTGEIVDQNSALQQTQLRGAGIGVETAWENYQAAVKARDESRDIFELQVDGASLNVERAEDAYDDASDAYDDLQEEIDDLEDEIDALADDDENRASMEAQLEAMEAQLEQLDKGIDAADDGITLAENAVEQIEEGYDAQLNQLNLGVEMALNQYQAAVNQYNAAGIGSGVASLSSDLQLLQAQSAYSSAQISADAKTILSPISGVITQVLAKMDNLVAPGQVIFMVENPKKMSVKTSVSLDEVRFLRLNEEVKIWVGAKVAKGKIISISPVLNEMTRKVDVEIEVLEEGVFVSGELVKIAYRVVGGNVIFVPLMALDVSGEGQYVKIVNVNGKVEFRTVKMGQVLGGYAEILSGLRGNEVVISSPSSLLSEGERVNVKPVKIER